MARIRSLHPGQWTDDQFVTTSPLARLLALGVRNEADDNGVFEWNPVKLKMRLLPMDNCDVAALLTELDESKQVRRYEVDGKPYGIIRNFAKYQRPKKPKAYHPLPPEVVGAASVTVEPPDPPSSEPLPHKPPIPPAEVRCKRLDVKVTPPSVPPEGDDDLSDIPEFLNKKPASKRGERLKAENLPDDWREWAVAELGMSKLEPIFDKFRDYWIAKPGQGGVKLDWFATWRNWCRRELESKPNGGASLDGLTELQRAKHFATASAEGDVAKMRRIAAATTVEEVERG